MFALMPYFFSYAWMTGPRSVVWAEVYTVSSPSRLAPSRRRCSRSAPSYSARSAVFTVAVVGADVEPHAATLRATATMDTAARCVLVMREPSFNRLCQRPSAAEDRPTPLCSPPPCGTTGHAAQAP